MQEPWLHDTRLVVTGQGTCHIGSHLAIELNKGRVLSLELLFVVELWEKFLDLDGKTSDLGTQEGHLGYISFIALPKFESRSWS